MNIKRIKKFRFCKSKKLEKVINLGYQHLQAYFQKQQIKINNNLIKFAADRNFEKEGLKTSGSNITIISESKSRSMKPDYYLTLPWHFKEEFIKSEKKFFYNKGKFIFPLSKIEII